MCFNVSLAKDEKEIARRFQIEFDPELLGEPFFHRAAFSRRHLPVIMADQVKTGLVKKAFPMEWGLIPHWVKDSGQARGIQTKTVNARCETIFEKPSFKKAVIRQRGILPVDGFFEYRHFGKKKIPYYIKFSDHRLFALAVIYNFWEYEKENKKIVHKTFSVITTDANPLLARIHNSKQRMPVILWPQDEERWLDPELPRDQIMPLFKPYPDNELTAYPVARLLHTGFSNVPEILNPASYDEVDDEERSLF